MEERPVTVRLLDPPLHEFLPKGEKEIADLALELKIQPARVHERISELQEVNPMLGFRGLRPVSYTHLFLVYFLLFLF